jgi:FKBP-type peptidyl-prolyl cis-trans isomerase
MVGIGQFPPGVEQVLTQCGKGGKFRVRVSGDQTYSKSEMPEIPSNMPLIIDMEVFGVK